MASNNNTNNKKTERSSGSSGSSQLLPQESFQEGDSYSLSEYWSDDEIFAPAIFGDTKQGSNDAQKGSGCASRGSDDTGADKVGNYITNKF